MAIEFVEVRKERRAIMRRQIDNCIAALVALRLNPKHDSEQMLAVLRAVNDLEGRDGLIDAIEDMASDLAPAECLACGRDCHGACDRAYDDMVARDFGSAVIL